MPVYEAKSVHVAGLDFSSGPIPLCKAEAIFKVSVTDKFEETDLDDWQCENDVFTSGLVFLWKLPPNDMTDDLDLTMESHCGAECLVVDDEFQF